MFVSHLVLTRKFDVFLIDTMRKEKGRDDVTPPLFIFLKLCLMKYDPSGQLKVITLSYSKLPRDKSSVPLGL